MRLDQHQILCFLTMVFLFCGSEAPAASLSHADGVLRISNRQYRVELDTAAGLGWGELSNLSIPPGGGRSFLRAPRPARIFDLTVHLQDQEAPLRLDSLDFRVSEVTVRADTGRCDLTLASDGIPVRLGLTIQTDDSCQTSWRWTLASEQNCRVDFVFPVLEGLKPGEHLSDVGYFFPRDPGLINHVPTHLLTNYGQYATSQLVAVFNDNWGPRGGGIYYMWQDESLHRKSFELLKVDPAGGESVELLDRYGFPFWDSFEMASGVGVASCLPNILLSAGRPTALAPAVIGIHEGNWRKAFADYRTWVDTWYRPGDLPAFAKYFTFASYHAPGCSFWVPDTVDEAISGIPESVDQLHFIAQKVDRYGDYDHYREDWGLDGLRKFVAAAHERGKLCSHYFQGYLAHADSEVFRSHGDQWGLKDPDGANSMAFANNCMCLSATGWHDWLARVTARAVRDIGLDIVYLDCLGWTTGEKFICHNERHPHPPQYHRLSTVRDLLHTVKQAIRREKPDVALTTEGPAVDLFFNDLDGNEGYGLMFSENPAYGPPIHLMRFLYPEFKYLDLRTNTPALVKQVLFNATATAADPEAEPAARMAHRVFHENSDAFVEGLATPHLPTREPGVYCNRFEGGVKTVYTVLNDNDYPTAGALVPIEVAPGEHVVDAIRHREGLVKPVHRRDHLVIDLPAKDVGVYAVVPRRLAAQIDGMFLRIDDTGAPGGMELLAALLDGEGEQVGSAPLGEGAVDLVALTGGGQHRAILRLMGDGRLVDELELPLLGDIDIARSAAVAACNVDKAHGSHPGSVVGQPGQWRFAWDDEPRPGWIELTWGRAQTFNCIEMEFERSEYSSRDCEVLASTDGATWTSIARGSSDEVAGRPVAPTTARFLRVVFHQGGEWANLVSLTRLRVGYRGE